MDIKGLDGLSSQYQGSVQDLGGVGSESTGQQPQVQSNESPFGNAGSERVRMS